MTTGQGAGAVEDELLTDPRMMSYLAQSSKVAATASTNDNLYTVDSQECRENLFV